MHQRDALRVAVLADNALNGGKRRREERHPVAADHQIGFLLPQLPSYAHPRQWIARVDSPANLQSFRRLLVAQLRLAREEEVRVLCGERNQFNFMPLFHELLRQPLVERRQPTPEGVGCTDDYYVLISLQVESLKLKEVF